MNVMQVAVVLIRLSGIIWFVQAAVVLFSLPANIWELIQPHAPYWTTLYKFETADKAFRIVMYVCLGSVYWLGTVPLARYVTKGLE